MAENSAIEWTHHTANAWWGCVKVSPLCDHCYAERDSTRYGYNIFGTDARRRFIKSVWNEVRKWDEAAKAAGEVWRVFWMSMGDIFELLPEKHPDRFQMGDARRAAFLLMEDTPNLHHLLLTKRISNVRYMVPARWLVDWPRHIRIGVSVGTQKDADRDIPRLLQLPCPNFLSMEPLLEVVNIDKFTSAYEPFIQWVITGGESGPKARPSHPNWFRSLRDQCDGAGVPFFFKQHGEWKPICEPGDWSDALYVPNRVAKRGEDQADVNEVYGQRCTVPAGVLHLDGSLHTIDEPGPVFIHGAMQVFRVGKKAAGRMLDGREWDGFPEVRG